MLTSNGSKDMGCRRMAWVTVLTSPNYVTGAMVLAHSLEEARTKFNLVILVTERISGEDIARLRASSPLVQIRDITCFRPLPDTPSDYAFPRFLDAWTKMRCFELTEFDVVGCLDSDMLVVSNMDHLLVQAEDALAPWRGELGSGEKHIMASHACVCNPVRKPKYPAWWNPSNCAYTNTVNPQDIVLPASHPRSVNIMDLDVSEGEIPYQYFNTGFFIVRPNTDLMDKLTEKLYSLPDLSSFQFAEQDYMSRVFKDHWLAAPLAANFLKTVTIAHPHLTGTIEDVMNIHYIMTKPWDMTPEESTRQEDPFFELNQLWRNAFSATNTSTNTIST